MRSTKLKWKGEDQPDPARTPVKLILSQARNVSGMDSTFIVHGPGHAVLDCVNEGPLQVREGQCLDWLASVSQELHAAASWQTHELDAERSDDPVFVPPRVKTLFVLPIEGAGAGFTFSSVGKLWNLPCIERWPNLLVSKPETNPKRARGDDPGGADEYRVAVLLLALPAKGGRL